MRGVIRWAIVVASATTILACDASKPTRAIPDIIPTVFSNKTPDDIEQVVTVEPPPNVEDARQTLGLTSVITNRGVISRRVIVRSCQLLPEDINTNAGKLELDSGLECPKLLDTLDLAPGESSPTVPGQFLLNVPSGVYALDVHHSQAPAFYVEARFRKEK